MTGSGPERAESALKDDPPIVDAHAHIFLKDAPLAANAWMPLDYGYSADQYLHTLDAHGIHFGVISGISISGYYNDYMLEELRRRPRLRGTVILPPSTDRYTLERMKADGVVGVRLQITRLPQLPDFDSEEWRLFFRRIRDLDWHVHFALEGAKTPDFLAMLERTGVKIMVDHFGHPEPEQGANCEGFKAVLRSAEKGRTWVKMASAFRLMRQPNGEPTRIEAAHRMAADLAKQLFAHVGPERLVWGSDCPFVGHEPAVTYRQTLDGFAEWAPDPRVRRRMYDTALKLYFG
ncbi:MAG: amidohydrolase family protein [Caulobacteraceae bacterium]